MGIEKLNKWADLLLDTGKRNNLINFRGAKKGSVEIVYPDVSSVFSKAAQSASFEVYDPKMADDDDFDIDDGQNGSEDKVKATGLSKAEYVALYSGRLKKHGQILAYNYDFNPITAIKYIGKRAKTAIEETGINIAYMAFGFVDWFENDNKQGVMHAPLLLLPISIENESSAEPYYIKIIDDEIIVNPTFSFKLQNEFGIKLPEYEDEELSEYLSKIENVVSKLKWTVTAECRIGVFSFLKINMHKDLKDNAKKILKNTSVRVLLGDDASTTRNISNEEIESDFSQLHNVIDADSSQSRAIEMARNGKSFVLQGPPGTGKSQTITNIIAECLVEGKKVLFVSEKLAALSVVYEKLKRVGLEEFCLELHSHKANKKEVIDELCRTLKAQKSGVSSRAGKILDAKLRAQAELDEYVNELHKTHSVINKSLYQIFEEVSSCRSVPTVEFVVPKINTKGEKYIEETETALTRFVEYIPSVGYDYHKNTWYGYNNFDCSYQTITQVKEDFRNAIALCQGIQGINLKLREKYAMTAQNISRAYSLRDFLNLAKKSDFITPFLLKKTVLSSVRASVKDLQLLAVEILALKKSLDEVFNQDIYSIDGKSYHEKLTKQFGGFFKRLFSREYKSIIGEIKQYRKDGKKAKHNFAVTYMETLGLYQQKMQEYGVNEVKVNELLGSGYKGIDTDFEALKSELESLKSIIASGIGFGRLSKMTIEEFVACRKDFALRSTEINKYFKKYENDENRLALCFDANEYNVRLVMIDELIAKYQGCIDSIAEVDNWCEFAKLLGALSSLDVRAFVDRCIEDELPSENIVSAYKKAFYLQWMDSVLHDSPLLLTLSRVPHDETVKTFKEKDELHFEINKAKIKASLSAERPSLDLVAQGSAISVLLREGEKKRKQKSIRLLLEEIGELAQTLKPCFLMSPLSVSTFLNSDMSFDVIVFDEASQIFPQDAIGAIYRGKQLIVVGDSKQMPPSNFFNSMSGIIDDDNEEVDDITDFESILDLCSTSFPQVRLKWHYRSRFEQLIAFSNKNFYENELVTFPSCVKQGENLGVDYFYVDGVFDRRSKTNRKEAEYIVDLVFENIEKYPERSLGVVAFSISQQNLIDKLLSKRRQEDPSKEVYFKSGAEPFFIKNLETVQGDERDTIIFSIAYAKDKEGRLLLNFGPINRQGGERRLNVAITRAKYNVQVVSSMHYTDIDLARTNSLGARLLREYLDYAENGEVALERLDTVNFFEENESEFEKEVAEFLTESGYEVDTAVGCSTSKIDVAVKSDASDYVLAIECDGDAYRASKNVRDRDRLRQEVLERMGWGYYRIWSTDWFRNKSVEKERLLTAVKNALQRANVGMEKEAAKDVSFEEIAVEKHFEFPKYSVSDVQTIAKVNKYDILKVTKAILKAEAPLSEEWLLKRIVFMFGREKVTNVVREAYESNMWHCEKVGILRRDGFLYLKDMTIPMLRIPETNATVIRDVKYIALEELALGIKEILKQNISVEKGGLFRLIVQQLGFTRIGDAIQERLDAALVLLGEELEINGEMLSLK